MTVDGVEEPGEGQAEDGAQEKHPDHHLLLDGSHKRHVGPEHVHQAQAEEEQAACRRSHKHRSILTSHHRTKHRFTLKSILQIQER